ncbi:MAG: hypothetical protein V4710_16315 [Verrucomicrobiota bacterium]
MNTMTLRDRWLAAALPAMLILLLGWLILLRPAGREVAQLRQRVQNQGSLDARRALVASAQADRADLEKAIAEKRRLPLGEESVFDRNWALQQISRLCVAQGLSLNKSAPDPVAQLSPALKNSLPLLAGNGTPPQLWRLELGGTYPGIVKLLEGLQRSTPLIIPLNLSMESGRTARQPSAWVLTLCL